GSRRGTSLARHALVRYGPAEGDAFGRALAHLLERALGLTDEPHAVMDASGPEAPLSDLEPAPLAEQDVRRRHPHVLHLDFHVAVRRIVIAEDRQVAQDLDALGPGRHQDHRLLAVTRR